MPSRRTNGNGNGKKLTEEEIGNRANAEIMAAITYDGTDFQRRRVRALEYYRGEMRDVDNEDGTSNAVSRDVKDVISWMLPGLMRVFFSTDTLGEYYPEDEDDEDAAQQATDYINYVVRKECNGYEVFWDVFHDALLFANGVVKHWWETQEKISIHFTSGLDDDQFAYLVNQKDVTVLAHREDEIEIPQPDPFDTDAMPIQLPPQALQQGPPPGGPPGAASPPPGGPPNGAPPPGGQPPGGGPPPPPGGGPPGGPPPTGGSPPGPPGPPGGPSPAGPPPAGPGGGLPPGIMALLGGGAMGPGGPLPPGPPPTMTVHTLKFKRTKKTGRLRIEAVPPEEFLINIQARNIGDARFVGHRMLKTRSELIEMGYDPDIVNTLPSAGGIVPDFGMLPQTRIDTVVRYPAYPGLDKSMEEVEICEAYLKLDADGDGIAEMMQVVMGGPNTNVVLAHQLWEDEVPFTDFVANRLPHRWQGESVFEDTEDVQRIKTTLMRQFLDNLYHSNIPDRAVAIDQITNPDSLIDRKIGNIIHTEGNPQSVIADLQVPFVAKEAITGLEYMDQVIERRTGVSQSTMALDLEALQNQSATAVNAAQSSSYSKIELIARNFAEMGFKRFFQNVLKLMVAHQDEPRKLQIKKKWIEMNPADWNAEMKFGVNVGLGSGSRDRDMQILTQIAAKQEQINLQLGPGNPLCSLENYANTLRTLVQFALPNTEPDRYFNEIDMNDPKVQAWIQQQSQPKPDPKAMAAQMQAQTAQQKAQADIQLKQQKLTVETQMNAQKTQAEIQSQNAAEQAKLQAEAQANVMHAQVAQQDNLMNAHIQQGKIIAETQTHRQANVLDAELKQHQLEMEAQLQAQQNHMQTAADLHTAHVKAATDMHKTHIQAAVDAAKIKQQKVNQKEP